MSEYIVMMMIGISTLLGALGLLGLLWGIKTGQFDDQSKFIDGARFDGEEALRDAVMMDEKKKQHKKRQEEKDKAYMPPD